MTEIENIGDGILAANQLLNQLAESVLQLGVQLDIGQAGQADRPGRAGERRWADLVRQLFLIDALDGDRSVVITGEQGAGKTRLMRNLYPEAADWLEDNAGRGEKNPVRIVERTNLPEPRGLVTFRLPGPEAAAVGRLTVTREYPANKRTEWQRLVQGEAPDVLLCTLEVPAGFWGVDDTGFVLLPGLERGVEQHWQHVVRMVLATSRAAVVVADERRMANAAQLELLKLMRPGTSDDLRFVVAISRCEASPADAIADRVRRAAELFKVDEADVVPIGKDPAAPTDWVSHLLQRVDPILASATEGRRLETEMLRELVEIDLLKLLDAARDARRQHALDDAAADNSERFLDIFDRECDEVRAELDRRIVLNFGSHMGEARNRLRAALSATPRWKTIGGEFLETVRFERSKRFQRLAEMVDKAWWGHGRMNPLDPTSPNLALLNSVWGVAETRWEIVRQRFEGALASTGGRLDDSVRLALTGQPPKPPTAAVSPSTGELGDPAAAALVLRRASADQVIKALPSMVLYARAYAIELARPDGRIGEVTAKGMTELLERMTGDRKQLLLALGLLLGGDLIVDGELDLPANLASAIFAGSAPAAGAAATAGSAMMAAIGVGVIAAVLIKAGNDALDEREVLADQHLQKYRLEAEQGLRQDVDQLLQHTREMLQARLYTALGVNRALNSEFLLLAAAQKVEAIRARMLEAIGHAEFG